jgi:hypothetical protein
LLEPGNPTCKKGGLSMVEFTNIKDNSEEIQKCIVNCETEKNLIADEKKPPLDIIVTKEEYIDEP